MSGEEIDDSFYEIDERSGDVLIDELTVLTVQKNRLRKLHISAVEMRAAEWASLGLLVATSQTLTELEIQCERRCHVAHLSLLIAGLCNNHKMTMINMNRVNTIEPAVTFITNFMHVMKAHDTVIHLHMHHRAHTAGSNELF